MTLISLILINCIKGLWVFGHFHQTADWNGKMFIVNYGPLPYHYYIIIGHTCKRFSDDTPTVNNDVSRSAVNAPLGGTEEGLYLKVQVTYIL